MRVLILSPGDDTGAVGIQIKGAFDRWSEDIQVRAVRNNDNYARHPFDVSGWYNNKTMVNELYQKADIVHWMEWFEGEPTLWNRDYKKPVVLHHHGTRLREAPALYRVGVERKAIQLASTVDLLRYGPEIRWLPNPYNSEWLKSFRDAPHGSFRPLEIFHSPTNRAIKGTQTLIEATDALEGYNLTISEFRTWTDSLVLKGRSDVYYDGPYGLGNNAVEAFGMGIPVIAGLVPSQWATPQTRRHMIDLWGDLPFFEHNTNNLAERLREFAEDPNLRQTHKRLGLDHFARFHNEKQVVRQLSAIYNELLQSS